MASLWGQYPQYEYIAQPQLQGPWSNFEIGGRGGSTISAPILGGHKTLFLTNSFLISKILGGGGGARAPRPPYSAVPEL